MGFDEICSAYEEQRQLPQPCSDCARLAEERGAVKSLAWLMILQTPQICLTGSIFEYVVRDGLREWAKPPTGSALRFSYVLSLAGNHFLQTIKSPALGPLERNPLRHHATIRQLPRRAGAITPPIPPLCGLPSGQPKNFYNDISTA